VDDSVPGSHNLVAGANDAGYHMKNMVYGRDYEADIVTDIAAARAGDKTPDGEGTLEEKRGVEVGNIFKLGTRYSDSLGATFLDENGKRKPIIMGSYGIGVGRLLACVAEEYNDDYGLMLPITIAPYDVHLVLLHGDEPDVVAEELYTELTDAGIEVLFDDRDERPGVKFNDADLIGVPLRLTVSRRSLGNGGIEFKRRNEKDSQIIARDSVVQTMKEEIAALHMAIEETIVDVPYKE
jgi:prolyl-tRNA synthetase